MDIVAAYQLVGTYRGAAEICGTTHKTVRRVIERVAAGQDGTPPRPPRPSSYETVRSLVAAAVAAGKGRVSAKRLLPRARAAGYAGSDRNFRRLVAQEKRSYRQQQGRVRRPAVWSPGEHLVIDWGVIAGVHVFAAVLAWSRIRFVRFAADEQQDTTLALLAECFEALGGVAKVGYGKDTCSVRCCSSTPSTPESPSRTPPWPRRSWPTFRQPTSTPRRGATRSTRPCTARRARSRPSGWSVSGSCSRRCRRCGRGSARRR